MRLRSRGTNHDIFVTFCTLLKTREALLLRSNYWARWTTDVTVKTKSNEPLLLKVTIKNGGPAMLSFNKL